MIYTSNYATVWTNPKTMAISNTQPKGWLGNTLPVLYPKWSWIKMKDWDKFRALYTTKLLNMNVKEVAAICKDKILLCYESLKDGKHCHRELVREWFNQNGYECQEWPSKVNKKTKKLIEQQSLL